MCQSVPIYVQHILDALYLRVQRITIECETVIDDINAHMLWYAPESEDLERLLLFILANLDARCHICQYFLILIHFFQEAVVRFGGVTVAVGGCEVDSGD